MFRLFKSAGDAPDPPERRRPQPASPLLYGPQANLPPPNAQQQSQVKIAYATPVAMGQANPDVAQFLRDKQDLNEFFAQYLAGATIWPDRFPLVYRMPNQLEKRIVGAWDNIYKLEMPLLAQPPNERRVLPGEGGAAARGSLVGEKEKKAALLEFKTAGFNLRILKVLGVGGMGIAFLCEAFGTRDTPDTGRRPKLVLKYDAGGGDMTEEKAFMMVRTWHVHAVSLASSRHTSLLTSLVKDLSTVKTRDTIAQSPRYLA